MAEEVGVQEQSYQQQVLRYEYVLGALSDIGEELCRVSSFDAQLKSLLHLLLGTLGVRKGGIFLFDPLTSVLSLRCSWKLSAKDGDFSVLPEQVQSLEQLSELLTFTAEEFPYLRDLIDTFASDDISSVSVLKVRDKLIGLLIVGHKLKKAVMSDKERSFLTTLSRNIAVAINNFLLLSELRETNTRLDEKIQEVSILYQATQMIATELQLQALLDMAMNATSEITEVKRGSIWLFDEDNSVFSLRSHLGACERLPETLRLEESLVCQHLFEKKEAFIRRPESMEQLSDLDERIFGSAFISVPIVHQSDCLGVIHLCEKPNQEQFSERDQRLIRVFALQLGAAVKNAQLYEQAITDGLTHLYLHRYFKQRLFDELKRAARFNRFLALIMIDIDHFKLLNDNYGHQAGDEVLRRVAVILRKAVRTHDLPVRYGGEEFALVLPETDMTGAVSVAERVRRAIDTEHIEYGGKILKITASFGVSVFPDCAHDMDSIIKVADQALYYSKEHGRNQVTVAPTVTPRVSDPESPAPEEK